MLCMQGEKYTYFYIKFSIKKINYHKLIIFYRYISKIEFGGKAIDCQKESEEPSNLIKDINVKRSIRGATAPKMVIHCGKT